MLPVAEIVQILLTVNSTLYLAVLFAWRSVPSLSHATVVSDSVRLPPNEASVSVAESNTSLYTGLAKSASLSLYSVEPYEVTLPFS